MVINLLFAEIFDPFLGWTCDVKHQYGHFQENGDYESFEKLWRKS